VLQCGKRRTVELDKPISRKQAAHALSYLRNAFDYAVKKLKARLGPLAQALVVVDDPKATARALDVPCDDRQKREARDRLATGAPAAPIHGLRSRCGDARWQPRGAVRAAVWNADQCERVLGQLCAFRRRTCSARSSKWWRAAREQYGRGVTGYSVRRETDVLVLQVIGVAAGILAVAIPLILFER
jgi:hypothetical protein